ncbi:hypothetical protein M422DRAFT_87851, partial [Sphaerobolus stellatus SS14]
YHINLFQQVIDEIGAEHFAAIASDGAGNARVPREHISHKMPTIINFYDPAHGTNLACKDIVKLPAFKGTIQDIRRILSHFKHSTISTTLLTELRKALQVSRGLESIGKTRFATIFWAALSVQCCLPAIRRLIAERRITKVPHLTHTATGASQIRFDSSLNQLVQILRPFAYAIKCFESAHLMASDVFAFWLAIMGSVETTLEDEDNGIGSETSKAVKAIVN